MLQGRVYKLLIYHFTIFMGEYLHKINILTQWEG